MLRTQDRNVRIAAHRLIRGPWARHKGEYP
jgi:hypothetical protein